MVSESTSTGFGACGPTVCKLDVVESILQLWLHMSHQVEYGIAGVPIRRIELVSI